MSKSPQAVATGILPILKNRYPDATPQLMFSNPWQLLVATVLAAQCTDARVNKITPVFFQKWPQPADLAKAKIEDVEEVIHSTGLFHQKARNLILTARKIETDFDGKVPNNMQDLLKLPGIARKTANIVLFAGYGINEGIAVDTHVKRISYRLGLTGNTNPPAIEKDLVKLFPNSEWGNLNHRLVQFGRDMCTARSPKCLECELSHLCSKRSVKFGSTTTNRGKKSEP